MLDVGFTHYSNRLDDQEQVSTYRPLGSRKEEVSDIRIESVSDGPSELFPHSPRRTSPQHSSVACLQPPAVPSTNSEQGNSTSTPVLSLLLRIEREIILKQDVDLDYRRSVCQLVSNFVSSWRRHLYAGNSLGSSSRSSSSSSQANRPASPSTSEILSPNHFRSLSEKERHSYLVCTI